MYIPAAFHEQDIPTLRAFVRDHAFGLLVSQLDDLPFATHLPFLLETRGETDVLVGHVAKANAHVQALDGETESMAVFTGPHAYVSPRWVAEGPAVPTWNYAAVHCYGTPSLVEDEGSVRRTLAALTAVHEQGRWSVEDLDGAYYARMLNGVVAFEMPVDLWRGKFKLSQNKAASREAIADALAEAGSEDVAALMRKRSGSVSPP